MKPLFPPMARAALGASGVLLGARLGWFGVLLALLILLCLTLAREAGECDEHLERSMLDEAARRQQEAARRQRCWRRDDDAERLHGLCDGEAFLLELLGCPLGQLPLRQAEGLVPNPTGLKQ